MVVGDFSVHTECLVIGSGPGGYVAAIRASQLGKKVTIVERDFIGGTCLNVGCIPSKALIHVSHQFHHANTKNPYGLSYGKAKLDMKKTQVWKQDTVVGSLTKGIRALLKKHKVTIIEGEAHFINDEKVRIISGDEGQTISFDSCIIATGSRPIEIPGFPFGKRVLDSTGALALDTIPKSIAIVGGGYIGCELAGAYANLGSQITILEGTNQILPNFAGDLVKGVVDAFHENGVDIKTSVKAVKAEETDKSVLVTYQGQDGLVTLDVDYVFVTVGRRPNTDNMGIEYTSIHVDEKGLITVDDQGKTGVYNIYAIGDVTKGLALAHKASYEAKVVASVIAGQQAGFDYTVIPAVCYTSPEIAVVGLTASEAKDAGIEAKSAQFPFAANGRALSMNQKQGFVRITYEQECGVIIGAEIMGEHASELIGELTMAIESQLSVEDVSLIIHTHPTLSEMIMDVSEIALGTPIHI